MIFICNSWLFFPHHSVVTASEANCSACLNSTNFIHGHPDVTAFNSYVNKFLSDVPSKNCAKGYVDDRGMKHALTRQCAGTTG